MLTRINFNKISFVQRFRIFTKEKSELYLKVWGKRPIIEIKGDTIS